MIEEKLFPAILSVREAFKEKLSLFPDVWHFAYIPWAIIEESMNELGFTPDWNSYDQNQSSGDTDYWVVFRNKNKEFSYFLSASMMEPRAEIRKKPKDYQLYK